MAGYRTSSVDQATSDLAGVICHELNNIAVPLQGFADLALQDPGTGAGARALLDEIKVAVARLRSLATDLESLGSTAAPQSAVPIRECMPNDSGAEAAAPVVEWRCSPSTAIQVDPVHAQRALQALAWITGRAGSAISAAPRWSIAADRPNAARCAACGSELPRDTQVVVQAFRARPVPAEALKAPFSSARSARSGRRLSLAVVVHSTHYAGGHVFVDEGDGALTLAFPIA